MTGPREALFAQVKVFLESIDGNSPYTNTIRAVSRDDTSLAAMGIYPAIVMVEQSEPDERTASSQRMFRLARLLLVTMVEAPPGTAGSTLLNSIRSDILYRLLLDQTQGGTCHYTKYIDHDPQVVADSGVASSIMTFDFQYSFVWSAP